MFLEKVKQLVSKTENVDNKKKIENLVFFLIVLIVVLVAINLIWNNEKEETKSNETNKKLATYEETTTEINTKNALSEQLEDILQNINGVGKVKVLVTYSQSSQTIPLYNEETSTKDTEEEDKAGGTRKILETEVKKEVIYNENSGTKSIITQSTVSPKVEGAIVTAQGARNSSIKTDIIQAVEAVTGLASHKIQVFAMNED